MKVKEFYKCLREMKTYTNGLYKVFGVIYKDFLYGIVTHSPTKVYRKYQFLKSKKYHLPRDSKPQWYVKQ